LDTNEVAIMSAGGVEFSDEALAAAVQRLAGNVREEGVFNCAGCCTVKKAEFLYSVGVYIPDGNVMTEAGEKKRVIIYAVCALCGKKAPEKLEALCSQNCSGALEDREYHPPQA
jgi:hypothetical protein